MMGMVDTLHLNISGKHPPPQAPTTQSRLGVRTRPYALGCDVDSTAPGHAGCPKLAIALELILEMKTASPLRDWLGALKSVQG